jgi:Tfp pilus assembly protein PilZ
VRYACGVKQSGTATLADVDHSGVGITVNRRFAPGQRLMLVVDEPVRGKHQVELKGMVAWCEPAEVEGQFRAGIRIFRIDDETRLTLCLLVWAGLRQALTQTAIGYGPIGTVEWRAPSREMIDLSSIWRTPERRETRMKQATVAGY